MLIFYLLFSLAPAILTVVYINHRDRENPEPVRNIFWFFIIGFFMAGLAYVAEWWAYMNFFEELRVSGLVYNILNTLFISIVEEGLKFLALFLWVLPKKFFDEPFDGVVYSILISMGFASAENIFQATSNEGVAVLAGRMLTAVPAHALFAVFMGYFLGRIKMYGLTSTRLLLTALVPFALHFAYDFTYFQSGQNIYWLLWVIILSGGIISSIFLISKTLDDNTKFHQKDIQNA